MSNLREAAQQALVRDIKDAVRELADGRNFPDLMNAIDELAAEAAYYSAQPDDPTDPGHDVNVLREHVRHLERQVRQLHAEKLAQPDDKAQPLGWMRPDELQKAKTAPYLCRVHPEKDKHADMIPVYAAPQPPAEQAPSLGFMGLPTDVRQAMQESYPGKVAEQGAESWVGCGECDTEFGCHGGVSRCIRLSAEPNPDLVGADVNAIARKLAEIAKNDLEAIPLALHMLGIEPCHTCGYMKVYCRCPKSPKQGAELSDAVRDVIAERQRQVSKEGWMPPHDDAHRCGELARAAAWYALQSITYQWSDIQGLSDPRDPATRAFSDGFYGWPWSHEWWKPTGQRRDLVKSGALILAEIERLDRAADRAARGGKA